MVYDRYWCPAPGTADAVTYMWNGDYNAVTDYGYCPNTLFPEWNGCDDHYEAVGNLCFRISAYPETYANARLRCEDEGSSLAYIPSEEIQEKLGAIIVEKVAKYSFFVGVQTFWLGAYNNIALGDWEWDSYEKPVSGYNNWKAKKSGNFIWICVTPSSLTV